MGSCDCDDQIHVSNDCQKVFFCQTDLLTTNGCEVDCGEGKISVPNPRLQPSKASVTFYFSMFFRNGTSWYCIDQVTEDGDEIQCPGGWNTCGFGINIKSKIISLFQFVAVEERMRSVHWLTVSVMDN